MALSLVSEPGDIVFARNPVVVSLLSSGGPFANYRVILEVFFEKTYGSGAFTSVALLQGLPDDAGNVLFDLSSILEGECRADRALPQVPAWGIAAPVKADNLRKYKYRYSEESGTPQVQGAWTNSSVKKAMDGGVSQALFAAGNFFTALNATNSLLTWMADGKKIGLTQPEFLNWHNYAGYARTVVLERVCYDVDNNAQVKTFLHEVAPISVASRETLIIPCSLSIGTVPTDAYKVQYRVVDATSDYEGGSPTYVSQARTYRIDRDYYDSERNIEYLNSFGCPECWRCVGEYSKSLSISRQVAVKPLLPGYNSFASDRFMFDAAFENDLTFRSGYIRRGDAEVLAEMLIAGDIYDVSPDGYIPLLLTGTRFDISSTRRDLHFMEFSAQPRLSQRNFSKIQLGGGGTPEVDAWQEPDGEYYLTELLIPWDLP